MMTILSILVFLLTLTVIVVIHELGHFYFARKADILCHEFSIGMGPAIYQKRKGEIIYSIRAIPFGGYVAMAGEEMHDAYLKKDQNVGIRLNESDEITHIILDNDVQYDRLGKVVDFDLYGKDFKELFIELNIDGENKRFSVLRDAKYLFKDEKPLWITPAEKSFETKTLWQRFKVIFAGPAANLILAFVLLFVLAFFIGKPSDKPAVGKINDEIMTNVTNNSPLNKGDVITSVNNVNVETFEEVILEIYKAKNNSVNLVVNGNNITLDLVVVMQGLGFNSLYEEDNLIVGNVFGRSKKIESGDLIKGINISDKEVTNITYTSVNTWNELIEYVNNNDGEFVYIEYERDGETLTDHYLGMSHDTVLKLGANPVAYATGFSQSRSFNILYPLYYPFVQMGNDISSMINTVGLLINPSVKVGVGDLAGPIGIYSLVADSMKQGLISFISFVSFLSINIAILNLLPIPALDGGRLVFLAYEAITRKQVNKKVENMLINITFFLLLALIIIVSYNDILRIFN